jgi:hypothetical protein
MSPWFPNEDGCFFSGGEIGVASFFRGKLVSLHFSVEYMI